MKRLLTVFFFLILICLGIPALFDFPMSAQLDPEDDEVRFTTEPVLKAYNFAFGEKEISTLKFNLAPDDSIKIICPDCIDLVNSGEIIFYIQGSDIDVQEIGRKNHNVWLHTGSERGSFGIVFRRDKSREDVVRVEKFELWKKFVAPPYDASPVQDIIGFEGFFVDNLIDDKETPLPTVMFGMSHGDKAILRMTANDKDLVDNLAYNFYRQGESIAKERGENNYALEIPEYVEYGDSMEFEFGNLEKVKKIDPIYNVEIELWRKPPPRPDDLLADSLAALDSAARVKSREEQLLEFLMKKFGDVPQEFACSTPPARENKIIPGKLNLMPTSRNKVCFELQLSDECLHDTTVCRDCESFYVLWIGIGEKAINAFKLRDSERKAQINEGLLESYARALKFSNGSGKGIFPRTEAGEDAYVAVVNTDYASEFLQTLGAVEDEEEEEEDEDEFGPPIDTLYMDAIVRSQLYREVTWNGELVSICIWNNNDISPIPVFIEYQQFIYEPDTLGSPL